METRWLYQAILGVSLGLGATLPLAGAGPVDAAPARLTMTVIDTDPADMHDLPLMVAEKIAPEFNMEIKQVGVVGGGTAGQVFLGGTGDVLLAGGDKAIGLNKVEPGSVKLVGASMTTAGWTLSVLKNSPYHKIPDLKGKTIGITGPGSSTEMLVLWGLRQAGVDPKAVSRVALGAPINLQAALENHKVEGSALAGEAYLNLKSAGAIRVLGQWDELPYLGDNLMVRTKDLDKRREDFARFMTVFRAALHRIKTDRAFALAVARKHIKGEAAAHLERDLDYSKRSIWGVMDGVITKTQYDNASSIWVGSGRYAAENIPPYADIVVDLPSVK
jgi:ABC-type nitrate/sulfonate/bicarbonate transport system substrate-binding protein